MPNFPDPQSSVSLFEYRNKFVGGDFTIPWAHSIITGFGGLFILCVEDGSKVKARLILQPLLKVSFTEICISSTVFFCRL